MLPNIPFKAPHFHTLAQLTASVDSDSNVLIALWMFTTTDNVSLPTIQASDGNNGSPVSQLELTVNYEHAIVVHGIDGQREFP